MKRDLTVGRGRNVDNVGIRALGQKELDHVNRTIVRRVHQCRAVTIVIDVGTMVDESPYDAEITAAGARDERQVQRFLRGVLGKQKIQHIPLVLGGGSRTFVGANVTGQRGGTILLSNRTLELNGGLLVNNGDFIAINNGGISKTDFPKSIRDHAFIFTGMPFVDEEQNACTAGRQARNTRR